MLNAISHILFSDCMHVVIATDPLFLLGSEPERKSAIIIIYVLITLFPNMKLENNYNIIQIQSTVNIG
jgi:hypothetical protein